MRPASDREAGPTGRALPLRSVKEEAGSPLVEVTVRVGLRLSTAARGHACEVHAKSGGAANNQCRVSRRAHQRAEAPPPRSLSYHQSPLAPRVAQSARRRCACHTRRSRPREYLAIEATAAIAAHASVRRISSPRRADASASALEFTPRLAHRLRVEPATYLKVLRGRRHDAPVNILARPPHAPADERNSLARTLSRSPCARSQSPPRGALSAQSGSVRRANPRR